MAKMVTFLTTIKKKKKSLKIYWINGRGKKKEIKFIGQMLAISEILGNSSREAFITSLGSP